MPISIATETTIPGLHASAPEPLPFAPSLHARAFALEREAGNVLIYSTPSVQADDFASIGGLARAYLAHGHEASLGGDLPGVPLFVHQADRADVERRRTVRAAFSHRHVLDGDLEVIPIPGHTPGATAFLWDSGQHRFLFTGDTIYLHHGEWIAAVLDSSDRDEYIESLTQLRELDFDVLVPWIASAGEPYYAVTSNRDARRRLDAILTRVRRGEDR